MSSVDLVDETFIAARREAVAAVVADPDRWARWWPDLTLTVFMDRGLDGIRWNVRGALTGSCELWLEAVGDGVLLHYYLRVDPVGRRLDLAVPSDSRRADRIRARRATAWKRSAWALKDELEPGRSPGDPVTG